MSIMFPMITSLRELQDAKAVLEECRAELTAEGVKMGQNIEVGTMIETPRRRAHRGRAGRRVRLLLHRHQRPDPVHLCTGPPERKAGALLQPPITPPCCAPSR